MMRTLTAALVLVGASVEPARPVRPPSLATRVRSQLAGPLNGLVCVVLLGLVNGPLEASWQFAKWGMSTEALSKAAPVPLVDASAETGIGPEPSITSQVGQRALLKGAWRSGSFQFVAYFLFDSDKRLASVNLVLTDAELADALEAALRLKYGQAEAESHAGIDRYTWRTADEEVEFLGPGGDTLPCQVIYVARRLAANNGL